MSYTIKLSDFQGPLDLLIHLIEKDKIDIYDIPIVSITDQYIAYIDAMQEYDLDAASEFLLMAALLLQIKSRMLLPKEKAAAEEEADPRQMLVEMLVEYRKFKKRAQLLRECLAKASLSRARPPMPVLPGIRKLKQYSLEDLLRSLANLLPEEEEEAVVARQEFNVQDKMNEILGVLEQSTEPVPFRKLLTHEDGGSGEVIAVFLAVLELLRLKKIHIEQKAAFAPMYVEPPIELTKENGDGTDEIR